MEYICELKNISKRFHTINNETKAIDDISFKVKKGEIVSIVGPSGSGKSTVLSLIAGLEKPSEGEVIVNTNSIGFMFQKDQLYEWRNVYKNCLLGLEVRNMVNEENKMKVIKMLEKYGLTHFKNHYPSQLSGGMRQRAALVRTLAIEPDLLLLDEPFSALDYQTRLSIGDEVGTILRNEKISTILVTHDIPEAVSMSDRVIVFTERPAKIKKEYEIKFDECPGERTPMKCRNTLTFGEYFREIWRDLDVEKKNELVLFISKEHDQYLKSIKKEKNFIKISQVLIFVFGIILWEVAARYNLIDTFLTSSPGAIFDLMAKFISDGSLFKHLYVSTSETIAGFLVGTIGGFLIAILLWWYRKLAIILDPYIVILNSLPKTALAPIIILWIGMGFKGIVATAASISIVVTIMTLYTGFINVEQDKIILLKTMGANKFQVLKKVVIPANIPNILSVIRVNIGLSWIGVIVGEFLVSKAGIGYLILYGSQTFKLDLVMMGVFVLGIIAAIMYFFAIWLEKKVIKY